MQAFVKEGGGGDHISVGVKLPDQKMERPIQNANLFVGPKGMKKHLFCCCCCFCFCRRRCFCFCIIQLLFILLQL